MSDAARNTREPDQHDIDKEAWVLASEVMRYLGITTPTLYRWMDQGLPSHQVVPRGKRYFVIHEIDSWLTSRSTSTRPGQVVA